MPPTPWPASVPATRRSPKRCNKRSHGSFHRARGRGPGPAHRAALGARGQSWRGYLADPITAQFTRNPLTLPTHPLWPSASGSSTAWGTALKREGARQDAVERQSPRDGAIGRPGALHTGYPEPGDCSLRSSSRHRRLTDSSLGRVNRSSGFDPQAAWPGCKVRQYECYGSDRVADRPSALHAEALRRRGWGTRLAPSIRAGELLPDRRPPEPLFASAASPEFPLGLALKAWLVHQVPTLPRKARGANIGSMKDGASADISSG